jgi:hypothetical protein
MYLLDTYTMKQSWPMHMSMALLGCLSVLWDTRSNRHEGWLHSNTQQHCCGSTAQKHDCALNFRQGRHNQQ